MIRKEAWVYIIADDSRIQRLRAEIERDPFNRALNEQLFVELLRKGVLRFYDWAPKPMLDFYQLMSVLGSALFYSDYENYSRVLKPEEGLKTNPEFYKEYIRGQDALERAKAFQSFTPAFDAPRMSEFVAALQEEDLDKIVELVPLMRSFAASVYSIYDQVWGELKEKY